MPNPVTQVLTERKLSTRDKRVKNHVLESTENLQRKQADYATELSAANIAELGHAIDRQKDPKLKAILLQELEGIRGLANALGPNFRGPGPLAGEIPPTPYENAIYDPATQNPGWSRQPPPPVEQFIGSRMTPSAMQEMMPPQPAPIPVEGRLVPNRQPGGVVPPHTFGGIRG